MYKATLNPWEEGAYIVPCKENLLWWQKKGLTYTATGYGKKIPTPYMIRYGYPSPIWRRVYCRIFSNSGTLYVVIKGQEVIVNIDRV